MNSNNEITTQCIIRCGETILTDCNICNASFTCSCSKIIVDNYITKKKDYCLSELRRTTIDDILKMNVAICDTFWSYRYNESVLVISTLDESFVIHIEDINLLTTEESESLTVRNITAHDCSILAIPIPVKLNTTELIEVKLPNVVSSNADQEYMRLLKSVSKKSLSKIIHDNNLKFKCPNFTFIYYDIETYSTDLFYNDVPKYELSHCHIATIELLIQRDDIIEKIIYVNNEGDYQYNNVDAEIIMFESEEDMCREFFNFLSKQNHCIAIGFHSNANVFGIRSKNKLAESGYDLPFILTRSREGWTPVYTQWCNKYFGENSLLKMSIEISAIEQLPRVHFVDAQRLACDFLLVEKSYKPISLSLENIAQECLKTVNKNHIDFNEQRNILLTKRSDISELLNYGIEDCIVTKALCDKFQFTNCLIFIESWNVPITNALYNTEAENLEHYILEEYRDNNFLVRYDNVISEKRNNLKGALTLAVPGFVNNMLELDYQSHYPTMMHQFSLSPENLLETKCDDCIVTNINDENIPVTYFWKQSHGILDQLLRDILIQRIEHKRLLTIAKKTNDKKSEAYHNQEEYCLKIAINTAFGLTSQESSSLFVSAVGQAITGMGRQTIQSVIDIAEQELSLSVVAVDTDAVNIKITETYQSWNDIQKLIDHINARVESIWKRSDGFHFMKLDAEEMVIRAFIIGRKSYIWLALKDSTKSNWSEETQLSDANDIKTRGIVFSELNQEGHIVMNSLIQEFMQEEPSDLSSWLFGKIEYYIAVCKDAVKENNKNSIQEFCHRIKATASSEEIINIVRRYPHLSSSEFFQCVYINSRISNKIYDTITPLSEIVNLENINVELTVKNFMSKFQKIINGSITSENKQEILSKYKTLFEQQLNEEEEGEMLIRVESSYNHKRTHIPELIDEFNYQFVALEFPEKSFHEIITSSRIRFVMDIDSVEFDDTIEKIEYHTRSIIEEYTNQPVEIYILKNESKLAYHLFTNISVEIHVALIIASEIAREGNYSTQIIDMNIYRMNASLRLFNTPKINEQGIVNYGSIYKLMDATNQHRYMINSLTDTILIETPIHMINTTGLDCKYMNSQDIVSDKASEMILEYFTDLKINVQIHNTGNSLRITCEKYLCPIHNREHDRIGFYATQQKNNIYINCYADVKSKKKDSIILKLEDDIEIDQVEELEKRLLIPSELLYGAITEDNKYFTLSNNSYETVFIRSSLGTGKTEEISEFVKRENQNTLIVSHRVTFTNSLKTRYENLLAYNDIIGEIDFCESRTIACEIDSLERISRTVNVDILILDEVESLLSELASSNCRTQRAHEHFIKQIIEAKICIVMDGHLEQETVDIINQIRKQESVIYENIYQPYRHVPCNIILTNRINTVQTAILESVMLNHRQGKKTILNIMSRVQLTAIAEALKSRGLSVTIIHGKDRIICNETEQLHLDFKKNVIENIETVIQENNVFGYTSTLTAGVDIETPVYEIISWFVNGTADPMEYVQGLFRCRNFNRMTLYIPMDSYGENTSVFSLVPQGYESLLEPHESLELLCEARENTMRKYSNNIIVEQLQSMGLNINISKIDTDNPMKGLKIIGDSFEFVIPNEASLNATKSWIEHKKFDINMHDEISSVELLRSCGLNDQEILNCEQFTEQIHEIMEQDIVSKSVQKYINKFGSYILLYNKFMRLGSVQNRREEDIKNRKQHDVRDTRIHLSEIHKNEELETVSLHLPIFHEKLESTDDSLERSISLIPNDIKQHTSYLQKAYALHGFILTTNQIRKGNEKIRVYMLKELITFN